MKKTVVCTLTLILAVLLCTLGAAALGELSENDISNSGTWGDITWSYNLLDHSLTISGEGAIPDLTYSSKSASWDQRPWSTYRWTVYTLTVEEGVTAIGDNAFRDFDRIETLTLPESLTRIGDAAFYNSEALKSVNVPRAVEEIGNEAFYESELRELTFAEDSALNKIGDKAFMFCRSLTSVKLPDSITSLGEYAFSYDEALGTLTLPAGLEEIPYHSFAACSSLTELVIPESVKKIESTAFHSCRSLTELNVPARVEAIYDSAFGNCTALETVTFAEGSRIDLIGYRSFENCEALRSIVFPESIPLTQVGSKAFMGCKSLTEFHMPDTVAILGESAFEGSGLTSVTLPKSLDEIRKRTFAECVSLTSVAIPEGVRRIEDEAFLNAAISELTLPESLTHIGDRAFSGCRFELLTLPDRVTHVGEGAFAANPNLNELRFPAATVSIGYRVVENCPRLEMIEVDDGNAVYYSAKNCLIRTDRHELIAGCKNSTIPDDGTVTVIGEYAFAGSAVTRIMIPYCITGINMFAFRDCTRLRSVTFPTAHRLEFIAARAFTGCTALERISLVHCNKLVEIAYGALSECSRLREVALPSSLTTVGSYVLRNCGSLERVIYCGSADSWEIISRSSDWDEGTGEYTFSLHDYHRQSTGDEMHESTCRACGDVQVEAHVFGEWTEKDATKHKKSCFCGEVIYGDHSWNGQDHCATCGVEKTLKGRVGCFGSLSGSAMLALLICGAVALVRGKRSKIRFHKA